MRRRAPRRDILSLPYGVWFLEDGEVLFSREYRALWLRRSGKRITKCCGQKRVPPRDRTEYFHQGGVVTRELYRRLIRIERDFVAGANIDESMFWKPDVNKAVPKIDYGPNVIRFPGAVPQNDDGVA